MPKIHYQPNPIDWEIPERTSLETSKGKWRWIILDEKIRYCNLKDLSTKELWRSSTNISKIFILMRKQLKNNLKEGSFLFSDKQLENLSQSVEAKYQRYLSRHNGCLGFLYRLICAPFLLANKAKLITQIDRYKMNLRSHYLMGLKPKTAQPFPTKEDVVLHPEPDVLAIKDPIPEIPSPNFEPFQTKNDLISCLFQYQLDIPDAETTDLTLFEEGILAFEKLKKEKLPITVISFEFSELEYHFKVKLKDIEAFLNYLVLKDKIYSYLHYIPGKEEKNIQIYLQKEDKSPFNCVNKELLLNTHKELNNDQWYSVEDFSENELSLATDRKISIKDEMNTMLKHLYRHHYFMLLFNTTYPFPVVDSFGDPLKIQQILVLLLKKDIIMSINMGKNDKKFHIAFIDCNEAKIDPKHYAWSRWKTVHDFNTNA